jgi:hypothetical protein
LGIVRFILTSNLLIANAIKLAASLHLNTVFSTSLGGVGFVTAQVFDLIAAVSLFSVTSVLATDITSGCSTGCSDDGTNED